MNLELACLRHGFKLMFEKKMISEVPVIKLLEVDNARQGFIGIAEFNALLGTDPQPGRERHRRVSLQQRHGARARPGSFGGRGSTCPNMIRLPAEFSKSKKARALPITGALMDVIERRLKVRRLDCEFVFHRKGKRITAFAKAFKAAAAKIGMPELLPHDMRRSAVRNFRRSGLERARGDGAFGSQDRLGLPQI